MYSRFHFGNESRLFQRSSIFEQAISSGNISRHDMNKEYRGE